MTININEIFGPTIQGEGLYTGVPSIFVRLNGCNLRCAFANGSICDTPYTSHHSEKTTPIDTAEAANKIKEILDENPYVNHVVITGGEPMLQQRALCELLDYLPWVHITIETNGSIKPIIEPDKDIYWSVSPKLSNSCCFNGTDVSETAQKTHEKNRINYEAVATMMETSDGQLKFVYSGEETEAYIHEYLSELSKFIGRKIPWEVMIMPEGQTNEQITHSMKACVDAAIRNGWRVADRLHIRIWGDKRGV